MDMTPIKFSQIARHSGMFEKCTVEVALEGLSVFDKNGSYIGQIQENGFQLNSEYEYSKQIAAELSNRKIEFWDDKLAGEITLAEIKAQYPEERPEPKTEMEQATQSLYGNNAPF